MTPRKLCNLLRGDHVNPSMEKDFINECRDEVKNLTIQGLFRRSFMHYIKIRAGRIVPAHAIIEVEEALESRCNSKFTV